MGDMTDATMGTAADRMRDAWWADVDPDDDGAVSASDASGTDDFVFVTVRMTGAGPMTTMGDTDTQVTVRGVRVGSPAMVRRVVGDVNRVVG